MARLIPHPGIDMNAGQLSWTDATTSSRLRHGVAARTTALPVARPPACLVSYLDGVCSRLGGVLQSAGVLPRQLAAFPHAAAASPRSGIPAAPADLARACSIYALKLSGFRRSWLQMGRCVVVSRPAGNTDEAFLPGGPHKRRCSSLAWILHITCIPLHSAPAAWILAPTSAQFSCP